MYTQYTIICARFECNHPAPRSTDDGAALDADATTRRRAPAHFTGDAMHLAGWLCRRRRRRREQYGGGQRVRTSIIKKSEGGRRRNIACCRRKIVGLYYNIILYIILLYYRCLPRGK